ncbi:MAG: hypothetical protein ACTSXQ_07340 [Alphaproteobacteria bacterium]
MIQDNSKKSSGNWGIIGGIASLFAVSIGGTFIVSLIFKEPASLNDIDSVMPKSVPEMDTIGNIIEGGINHAVPSFEVLPIEDIIEVATQVINTLTSSL